MSWRSMWSNRDWEVDAVMIVQSKCFRHCADVCRRIRYDAGLEGYENGKGSVSCYLLGGTL